MQHSGRLFISAVSLADLYSGAFQLADPQPLLVKVADLLRDVALVEFDERAALEFGRVRGSLLRTGISVPTADLMIAATALAGNHTLITHNTADYRHIPALRLDDWLTP